MLQYIMDPFFIHMGCFPEYLTFVGYMNKQFIFRSLSLSLSLYVTVSVSFSLHVYVYVSVPVSVPFSLFSLSLFLFIFLSFSLNMSFFVVLLIIYFRLDTRCTYSCIGTGGKKCQNPLERVMILGII